MILYLDTSNLLKLFINEPESEALKAIARQAETIASSLVAYVETRAGIARARRSERLDANTHREALALFEGAWPTYTHIDITDPLVRLAGDLAEKHGLRGFDALHLASAITMQHDLGQPLMFSAADQRLVSAAQAEGLLPA